VGTLTSRFWGTDEGVRGRLLPFGTVPLPEGHHVLVWSVGVHELVRSGHVRLPDQLFTFTARREALSRSVNGGDDLDEVDEHLRGLLEAAPRIELELPVEVVTTGEEVRRR
jgi:hypothetical protein